MDDVPIPSIEDCKNAWKTFQAMYDAPAYVRRERAVEAAYDGLLERCRRQREEWLPMVRLRLGTVKALAGDWPALLPCLADPSQLGQLERLHDELAPKLRGAVAPTASLRKLRGALAELKDSIERFNRRWAAYLPGVDLARVNELRDGYNRWYLLEKECAVRSPRVARAGFVRKDPLTTESLFAALPLLPVPSLAP